MVFWKKKKLKVEEPSKPKNTEMHYEEGFFDPYIDAPCPDCGYAPIRVGQSCHTYEQNGHWVSCMNCGSAGDLYCDNEDCTWGYEWGLNPRNPRSEANEKNRPTWLIGEWPY